MKLKCLGLLLCTVLCMLLSGNAFAESGVYTGENYPESSHNYENNLDKTWVYTMPGAPCLRVEFSERTRLEENYDYLIIRDGEGNVLGPIDGYTGQQLSGKRIEVMGDTVSFQLLSDASGNAFGFKIDSITQHPVYPESEHPYHESGDKFWSVSFPGAVSVKVIFTNECYVNSEHDYIRVYAGKEPIGEHIVQYKGTAMRNKEITVPGEDVCVLLSSNAANQNLFGFSIYDMIPVYPNCEQDGHRYTAGGVCKNCGKTVSVMQLPNELHIISSEAFENTDARVVVIPETVAVIEAAAFAECHNLEALIFMGSPNSISDTMLDGCDSVSITARADSSAAAWADAHGVPVYEP